MPPLEPVGVSLIAGTSIGLVLGSGTACLPAWLWD